MWWGVRGDAQTEKRALLMEKPEPEMLVQPVGNPSRQAAGRDHPLRLLFRQSIASVRAAAKGH